MERCINDSNIVESEQTCWSYKTSFDKMGKIGADRKYEEDMNGEYVLPQTDNLCLNIDENLLSPTSADTKAVSACGSRPCHVSTKYCFYIKSTISQNRPYIP